MFKDLLYLLANLLFFIRMRNKNATNGCKNAKKCNFL